MSTKERKLLLGFASLFLAFFVYSAALEIYSMLPEPKGPISFAAHGHNMQLAGFHLMTPIVFFSLVFARKYIVSTILTGMYGLLLIASFFMRLDGTGALGSEGFYEGRRLLEIYNKSHLFDFVACVFVLTLLIWQVRILIRNLGNVSKLRGAEPLP